MVYWKWFIIGIILIILELILPSFVLIWFGIAAILTGIVALFVDSTPVLLLVFSFFSIISFSIGWFKFIKPSKLKSQTGQGKESIIGEAGIVISVEKQDFITGRVRFQIPVLGDETWDFISEDDVHIGDRVVISDIAGSKLKIKKP
ncbi:MAG: NfeD family protein [Desulfuromonadales bacterium]|nr:NfeD family protein [Desulfuromonadales bacterium]